MALRHEDVAQASRDAPDASEAYRLIDELYRLGVRMALRLDDESDEGRRRGWESFVRAQAIALAERGAMWERVLSRSTGSGESGNERRPDDGG